MMEENDVELNELADTFNALYQRNPERALTYLSGMAHIVQAYVEFNASFVEALNRLKVEVNK